MSLGLGDRHLDNIIMDFNNGDVVLHIDYQHIALIKGKACQYLDNAESTTLEEYEVKSVIFYHADKQRSSAFT